MTSQILLFDHPRSGGHLIERVLGNTNRIINPDNIEGPARGLQVQWLIGERYPEDMTPEQESAFAAAVAGCTSHWQECFNEAQRDGKILLINTHSFSAARPEMLRKYISIAEGKEPLPSNGENFTGLSDDILLRPGTVPIFNVRDPRLTVASAYRVLVAMELPLCGGRDSFFVTTTTLWNRVLYDFFVSHGIQPLVIDSDDVMTSEAFIREMASRAGLDPEQTRVSWPAVTAEGKAQIHPMQWLSQKGLYESTGIKASRSSKNVDMEREMAKWPAEFGEHLPIVEGMIRLAMPHYEYLYAKRLRVANEP